jgi:hypothetical protein
VALEHAGRGSVVGGDLGQQRRGRNGFGHGGTLMLRAELPWAR